MLIIGCDFHPGFQQLAILDNRTGRNGNNYAQLQSSGAGEPESSCGAE